MLIRIFRDLNLSIANTILSGKIKNLLHFIFLFTIIGCNETSLEKKILNTSIIPLPNKVIIKEDYFFNYLNVKSDNSDFKKYKLEKSKNSGHGDNNHYTDYFENLKEPPEYASTTFLIELMLPIPYTKSGFNKLTSNAFCACIRLSACCIMNDFSPSITSEVISNSRCAG